MGDRYVVFGDVPQVDLTSQSSNFATTAIEIQYIRNLSIQAVWTETGTSGATITPQVSNDGTNYSDLIDSAGAALTYTVTGDGAYIWEVTTNCRYIRLNVTVGGGTYDTFKGYFGLKDT